jgi:hypothetical protein
VCAGETTQRLAKRAREVERERSVRAKATSVDNSAPLGRERGRERERVGKETAADRWNPPVKRRRRAAWLGRARPVGLLWLFFYFPGFSNYFSISFWVF